MATTKKPATKSASRRTVAPNVDIKALTAPELAKKVASLRLEAVELKRGTKTGDVQNVHAYNLKRKEIARALTALNSKPAEGEDK